MADSMQKFTFLMSEDHQVQPQWSSLRQIFSCHLNKLNEERVCHPHTEIWIPTTCWIHYFGQQKRHQPEGGCNSSSSMAGSSWLRALPRASFKIHHLTVLYQHPLFPRIGWRKGNGTPSTAPPGLRQYPHISSAVQMQRRLCSDGCAVLSH